ncbi:MAG TPA: hypothetical protein VFH54_16525 [Mycobacteriales bacterium]|nr:hypothetical protein [Mycobacteriales bacterium]
MHTISRSAGAGLLVYGVGVTTAFLTLGAPGGAFEPPKVSSYLSSGHWTAAFAIAYVGVLSALGLLLFGHGIRRSDGDLGGTLGELIWGGAVAATATSVVGTFVTGGLDVAMVEGGRAVQDGLPLPVAYTISEIGNLLTVCAPAFLMGTVALVLAAKAPLPVWLRGFSALAGVCGILAPLYFTYFVFVLWTVVTAIAILSRRSARQPRPHRAAEPAVPLV